MDVTPAEIESLRLVCDTWRKKGGTTFSDLVRLSLSQPSLSDADRAYYERILPAVVSMGGEVVDLLGIDLPCPPLRFISLVTLMGFIAFCNITKAEDRTGFPSLSLPENCPDALLSLASGSHVPTPPAAFLKRSIFVDSPLG